MKFDYYIFNSYVPELDGDAPALYAKWFEQVELCDQLGFDCAWITEHHFVPLGGMLPNPQVLMGGLAQRTKRIRLGTAVTLLALHNPLRIAEDMAMLDVMSNGRIDVGIGRGMPWLNFGAFGVDWDSAQERIEESTLALREAWTTDQFSFHGKHFQCDKPVRVLPRPVQRPHPPMWMAANRDPAHFRWIGEHGLNLMTIPWTLPSLDLSRELIAEYRAGLRAAGHKPEQFDILGLFPAYVSDTPEQARAEMEPHWINMRRVTVETRGPGQESTYDGLVEGHRAFFGDPDMCRRQLDYVEQIGLTHVALHGHVGGLPQDKTLKSLRLFMTKVART